MAARLDTTIGYFEAGTVLIANRFRDEDIDNAHGMDCLVAVVDGPILLRRLIRGRNEAGPLCRTKTAARSRYDQTIELGGPHPHGDQILLMLPVLIFRFVD